jgi:hypothetical protein
MLQQTVCAQTCKIVALGAASVPLGSRHLRWPVSGGRLRIGTRGRHNDALPKMKQNKLRGTVMPVIAKLRCGRLEYATLALIAVASASAASAQDPLQWKFSKGAKYNCDMTNELSLANTGGPIGAQNATITQDLKMTWNIEDVTPEGQATIQLKIEAVKIKLQLQPPVGVIEYDSTSDKPPTGPAATLVPMSTAMMKAPYILTMTSRGTITDAKVPTEVAAVLKGSTEADPLRDIASPEQFKRLMQHGLPQFPEDAAKHEKEWTITDSAGSGKQTLETTYRFKGKKEVEGKQLAEFQTSVNVKLEGDKAKIAEQSSDGQVLFAIAEGWLESSQQEHHVTIEKEGGERTKIDQKIAVAFKQDGQESGEKTDPAEAKK